MRRQQTATNRGAMARFADELSAYEFLEGIMWPDGVKCPHCNGHGRIGRLNGASTRIGTYKCYSCRKLFSVTHGTIFSSSHVPLHKWLQAIYLTEGGIKPMRPHHLQQILNVSFKTASSIMRRLNQAAALQPATLGRLANTGTHTPPMRRARRIPTMPARSMHSDGDYDAPN